MDSKPLFFRPACASRFRPGRVLSMRTIICVAGAVLVLALGMGASGCSNVVPLGPTSATDPSPPTPTPAPGPSHAPTPTPTPTPPPTETVSTVAYTPDLQPVFASDCVRCHNDR